MHLATKVPNILVMRSAYKQRRSFKDSLPFPSKQSSGLTFENEVIKTAINIGIAILQLQCKIIIFLFNS